MVTRTICDLLGYGVADWRKHLSPPMPYSPIASYFDLSPHGLSFSRRSFDIEDINSDLYEAPGELEQLATAATW
jgi:hypothetical protein